MKLLRIWIYFRIFVIENDEDAHAWHSSNEFNSALA